MCVVLVLSGRLRRIRRITGPFMTVELSNPMEKLRADGEFVDCVALRSSGE